MKQLFSLIIMCMVNCNEIEHFQTSLQFLQTSFFWGQNVRDKKKS